MPRNLSLSQDVHLSVWFNYIYTRASLRVENFYHLQANVMGPGFSHSFRVKCLAWRAPWCRVGLGLPGQQGLAKLGMRWPDWGQPASPAILAKPGSQQPHPCRARQCQAGPGQLLSSAVWLDILRIPSSFGLVFLCAVPLQDAHVGFLQRTVYTSGARLVFNA